jgi:hypothetical protein
MKVLTTLTVSGGLNMASTAKDVFTIGTPLEHNDGNVDNLYVYANADFKNNVILGSSSVDNTIVNSKFTASSGVFLNNCSLEIAGGTIIVNGQDLLSGGDDESQNYVTDIVSAGEILTSRSGSTITLTFNTASLDGYKFLLNTSSYNPQADEKTVYFSFDPHYNNITYFNANSQFENLKSAEYAVSDISMSINLPPVQTHLGKTFTFINATYVGTASNDTIGYSASAGGLFTTSGKYSVHKITFHPYSSGNYTDYVGTGKLTNSTNFSTYLITNAVRDYKNLVGHEYETDQHNFITLQAISSSQFGYTWMIRDVNDYRPFSVQAI